MGCAQVKSKKNTDSHQASGNISGNLQKSTPQQQQQPVVIDIAVDKTSHFQITGKSDTALKNANLTAEDTPSKKQSLNEGQKDKDPPVHALAENAEKASREEMNCEDNDIEEGVGTSVANKVQQVQISQKTQPYFLGSIEFKGYNSKGRNGSGKKQEKNEGSQIILEEEGKQQQVSEKNQEQNDKELSKQDQEKKSENNQGKVVDSRNNQYEQSPAGIRGINSQKNEELTDDQVDDKDFMQTKKLNQQLLANTDILLGILAPNQPSPITAQQQQEQLPTQQVNEQQLNEQLKKHVMLLLKLNQFELAFDIAKRYIKIDTNTDDFQLALARAFHFQGKQTQALQLFKERIKEESLSKNGIQVESLEGLFGCMVDSQTQAQSKALLDEMISKDKTWNKLSSDSIISLANSYAQLQEFDTAKQLYRLSSVSQSYLASEGLAFIYILQDQKSKAKQNCTQALKQAISSGIDENSLDILFLQQLQLLSAQSK